MIFQYKLILYKSILACSLLFFIPPGLSAENLKEITDLQGKWKFSIGDDITWAEHEFNDMNWDIVKVPDTWENNGYHDYNGFAWYRKTFRISNLPDHKYVFLLMGYIDDVDEVYVNGKLVGTSGVFPPQVATAYSTPRKYPIPTELLNKNENNTIAVRVFDDYLEGGIRGGDIGLYYDTDINLLEVDLTGYWDFETINKTDPSKKLIYGQNQDQIFVPGFWENWGYTNYDGAVNYSTTFSISADYAGESLILVLGLIDDIDKVYLNDNLIGSVDMLMKRSDDKGSEYRKFRGYEIPGSLIVFGRENTLRIKVIDTGGPGGIYEGPIGITTSAKFEKLESLQKPKDWWSEFFENFWD
jgi:sialate O-acetylesterase